MPAFSAEWMVAMLSSRSAVPYTPDMAMQPRPTADTSGPRTPSFLASSMTRKLPDHLTEHDEPAPSATGGISPDEARSTLFEGLPGRTAYTLAHASGGDHVRREAAVRLSAARAW